MVLKNSGVVVAIEAGDRTQPPPRLQRLPIRRRRGEVMIQAEHFEPRLPALDHADDPRGGAVVWALLAVSVAMVVVILLTMM
jgi:hypothetical protein